MKKRNLITISSCLIIILYLSLVSFSGGISGQSAAGCTCHGASSSNTLVSLSGLPAAGYTNGTTYTLTVSVTNSIIAPSVGGFGLRSGFDLTSTDGLFAAISGTQTNGDNEILHATPLAPISGTASWTFTWTAPTSGALPMVFDLSGNATNGSGDNSDDEWNQTTITIIKAGGTGNTSLQLQCFIQGYWNGVNGMVPALANQLEPSTANACDTILVSLKDQFTNANIASTKAILNMNGTCTATFSGTYPGSYYIAISHRNAVETWSATPVSMAMNPSYNFTNANSQSYGSNMVEVATGVWAFYSGDLVKDVTESIDLTDIAVVEFDNSNFAFGYLATDINGDGGVDLSDFPLVEYNLNAFVFSNHP